MTTEPESASRQCLKPLPRGLILEVDDHENNDLHKCFMFVVAVQTNQVYPFEYVDPSGITDTWIVKTLAANAYAWIMHRLKIGYVSLRIPEVAHRVQSATRVIAHTGARVSEDDMLRLFDGYLHTGDPETTVTRFRACLEKDPRRLSNKAEIDDALGVVLRKAGCYGRGSATLEEYRKAISRDLPLSTQGRGSQLSQIADDVFSSGNFEHGVRARVLEFLAESISMRDHYAAGQASVLCPPAKANQNPFQQLWAKLKKC
jgi:hypothetical protein